MILYHNQPMSYKTFETERLLLHPTSEEDASFIFELLNTPSWLTFIGDRKVYSLDEAAAYIRERIWPQMERLGYGNYTVIRKSDGTKIGSCGLYDRPGVDGIDIGFAFLPAYEGQGYALEAASCIYHAAFDEFGITQLRAITIETNHKSRRLIEKLGLHFQGMIRLPNDPEELMLYVS